MLSSNYEIGKVLNNLSKYNINFNRCLILNLVCADYVAELLEQGSSLTQEERDKLTIVMNKLLK